METSFDFSRLLNHHVKKHKSKPTQFGSVAGGVQKRLEINLKHRKSSRLSVFDKIRNLAKCESPAPVVSKPSAAEYRRQQLDKWKEEKEKKKKEIDALKKKPFVVSRVRAPLKFVPPPPPKVVPSTSGRVTRSQSARIQQTKQAKETKQQTKSFAPKNATFCPPKLDNIIKMPVFGLAKTKKDKKATMNFTFDPILPTNNDNKRQTRSRTVNKPITEKKIESKPKDNTRTKVNKPKPSKPIMVMSSSSSDIEISPLKARRSLPAQMKAPNITPKKTQSKSPRKTPRKSISTPKNPVPKSESSSEERLRSPKSPAEVDVPMTPEQITDEAQKISPCVTMSRGKDNARREMKKKLEEGLLDEDASDMDSVEHFRKQLASEIKRMTEMCQLWDRIAEQTVLPEAHHELLLAAVGQARLLMSQKMQQFACLVERCARRDSAHALVTAADLHGFWDMLFMQVENVDMRFKKLEELQSRGWVEEPVVVARKPAARVLKAVKPAAKPAGKPAASGLREMIAAARRAKKEQEEASSLAVPENKTFEAGFFSVKSPVRSPAPATPKNKNSLLKAVLSSEAKKSASFAMLRASVLGKNVECEGVAPLPQTPLPNINATPGRSILKQKNSTMKKSNKKTNKMVLFNQSDSENNTSVEKQNVDTEQNGGTGQDGDVNIEVKLDGHDQKENSRRKSKLIRQDATDDSPVMTRSKRKSIVDEKEKTPRRRTRNAKVLEEIKVNVEKETPRRSSRRKSGVEA